MNLYKTLEPYSKYLFNLSILKGYIWLDMRVPKNWVISESILPAESFINFGSDQSDDNQSNLIRFVCEFDEGHLSDMEEKIEKFIKYNMEAIQKEELYLESTKALKEIFKEHSLDKLSNIKIIFDGEDATMVEQRSGER